MREDTVTDGSPDIDPPAPVVQSDFDLWVQNRYTEAVDASGDDGIDYHEAADAIASNAAAKIASGSMRLPIDVLARLVKASIAKVDDRERRKTNARITEIAAVLNGDTILGVDDPLLDAVALIGDGTRKTWRHVNHDDIDAMQLIKARHAQDAATSAGEFALESAVVKKALRSTGPDATVGQLPGLS